MKGLKLHSILNSVLLIGIIIVGLLYFFSEKQSMAYVDNIKLFNQFNMTNDIKTIEEKKIKIKSQELDSIYKVLELEKGQETDQAKRLIAQLNKGRKELEQIQSNYQNNLSQDVWNRLNTYIGDYAKMNAIEVVLGTNGNGNVMYAKDYLDITNQVLEFSNNKYEGK